MRPRTFAVVVLSLCLFVFAIALQTSSTTARSMSQATGTVATTLTGVNLTPVTVKIRVTGIAHLVDDDSDPAKRRLLVIPNHEGFFGGGHRLLLLVNTFFTSELLGKTKTRTIAGTTITYAYEEFPSGYEIDLEASGWVPPASPNLKFNEKGDATGAQCPATGTDTSGPPRDSLHWLPRLSTVSMASFTVKTSHKQKDPDEDDVLTRIDLKDGHLQAVLQAVPRRFEFDRDGTVGTGGDHVQAVADAVEFTFTAMVAPGKPFVLKGRKFKRAVADPEQWLELVRVMPNPNVVIDLANVRPNEFFSPKRTNTIPHFHAYYDIVDKPKKVKRVIDTETDCDGSANDSGVECGPIRVP